MKPTNVGKRLQATLQPIALLVILFSVLFLALPEIGLDLVSIGDIHTALLPPPAIQASDVPPFNPEGCQPDYGGSWSIGLFRGLSPLDIAPLAGVPNPVIHCGSILEPASNFVADPFLWRLYNGIWHLFFETETNLTRKGDIGVAESSDGGKTWRYLGLALTEQWHLSYPFVFEWRDEVYMLPEAGNRLKLYKAVDFPLHWREEAVLMDQPSGDSTGFADSTLIEWEGRWWMFTGQRKVVEGDPRSIYYNFLYIYYADNPLGAWEPHPLNPVMNDLRGARPAGRIIEYNGSLLRWGQDGTGGYGQGVVAFRIERLTPSEFREVEVDFHFIRTGPNRGAWNGRRHHHVDAHELEDGSWLVAMDGDRVP